MLHHQRGLALDDLGQYEGALASFQLAVKVSPKFREPYYRLGKALIQLERYDEAVAFYEPLLERSPGDAQLFGDVAWLHLRRKDFEGAVTAAKRASVLLPKWVWPYTLKAEALAHLNRTDEAVVAYEQAAEAAPELAAIQNDLGVMQAIGLRYIKRVTEFVREDTYPARVGMMLR